MWTIVVLLLLCLPNSHAGPLKNCPIDCSPNGYCFDGECQCTSGFAGADCSFPYEICPDHIMQCYGTGARCVQEHSSSSNNDNGDSDSRQHAANGNSDEIPSYKCQCDTKNANMDQFQIEQCEKPFSQHCQVDQTVSEFAFCTNGGTCRAMVQQGQRHAGCFCPTDFEGRHCQYRKGTAPAYELQDNNYDIMQNATTTSSTNNNNQSTSGALDRFIKFIIAVVCLSVIAGFGSIVYHNYQAKQPAAARQEFEQSEIKCIETDLTMDVSGDEMDSDSHVLVEQMNKDNNDHTRDVDKGEMA
jgi:hypothetical protein